MYEIINTKYASGPQSKYSLVYYLDPLPYWINGSRRVTEP